MEGSANLAVQSPLKSEHAFWLVKTWGNAYSPKARKNGGVGHMRHGPYEEPGRVSAITCLGVNEGFGGVMAGWEDMTKERLDVLRPSL